MPAAGDAAAGVRVAAAGAEAAGVRVAAEAFLGVEVVFREEIAVSLEATEASLAVMAVSLEVAVSLAVEVMSPAAVTVLLVAVVPVFPAATIVSPAEARALPLDITVLRTILRCSPISAGRVRVVEECHRIQSVVNRVAVVRRWGEAQHSCPPPIAQAATWEIVRRKFPLVPKAGRVQARVHLSA
ncbi:MAG TPA: hypothetical protein VGM62_14040 [Chthoniobacterales bacterium]